MANEFYKGAEPYRTAVLPSASAQAQEICALCYWDGSAVRPFSYLTGSGSAVLDQEKVASAFVGAAIQKKITAELNTGHPAYPTTGLLYATDTTVLADCASATFECGDLVGAVSAAATAQGDVSDNTVVAVGSSRLAIGWVVEKYASATTKVLIRLLGKNSHFKNPNLIYNGIGGTQPMTSEAAADSAVTLTVASKMIQTCIPTAARTFTLPAVAQSKGMCFIIVNNSAGANTITVQNAAASTIGTVAQNKRSIFFCDGATWFAITGA